MLLKTRQKRKQAKETLTIQAGSEEIKASKTEKLLGIEIEDNLGFEKHINSLVEKLEVGLKAIRAITGIANFKTRKSILNGLITSRLTYMIPLWIGAPKHKLDKLQKLQTKAMRTITKKKWEIEGEKLVSTSRLLTETGQLSIRQMGAYHTLLQMKKNTDNRRTRILIQQTNREKQRTQI